MADKPPFKARREDMCESCKNPVAVGDEVKWGQARGAVIHTDCGAASAPPASCDTPPNNRRSGDEAVTNNLEKTAFRLFEQLCASSGTADWDEKMLASRSFKLAAAWFHERTMRRKSTQGEPPIGYEPIGYEP